MFTITATVIDSKKPMRASNMFAPPQQENITLLYSLCGAHVKVVFFCRRLNTTLSFYVYIVFFLVSAETHFAELQRFSSEQQSSLSGHEAQRLPEPQNNVELGVQNTTRKFMIIK